MKKLIPLLIFIFPFVSFAQHSLPVDKRTGHIIYSETVNVNGVSKDELSRRMKALYTSYRTAGSGMQVEAESASSILCTAYSDVILNNGNSTEKQRLTYTLMISFDAGAYSYEIKDFSLQRFCIPARPVACEIQTKPTPVEAVYVPTKRKKEIPPYSLESELNKVASSLISAMKSSASTERQLAGINPK